MRAGCAGTVISGRTGRSTARVRGAGADDGSLRGKGALRASGGRGAGRVAGARSALGGGLENGTSRIASEPLGLPSFASSNGTGPFGTSPNKPAAWMRIESANATHTVGMVMRSLARLKEP